MEPAYVNFAMLFGVRLLNLMNVRFRKRRPSYAAAVSQFRGSLRKMPRMQQACAYSLLQEDARSHGQQQAMLRNGERSARPRERAWQQRSFHRGHCRRSVVSLIIGGVYIIRDKGKQFCERGQNVTEPVRSSLSFQRVLRTTKHGTVWRLLCARH